MSLSSIRLGIILIGLGLLIWGLLIQSKYEGFQGAPATEAPAPTMPALPPAPPPPPSPAITPPPPSTPPLPTLTPAPTAANAGPPTVAEIMSEAGKILPVSYDNDLSVKDAEIRNKFILINKNRLTTNIIFTKYLSDTDDLYKLKFIYDNVKDYVATNFAVFRAVTDSNSDTDKNTLRQIVYTTHDEVNLLYKIYYTIPSIIISSGITIEPNTAGDTSVIDDEVIASSINMIKNELAGIPSINQQLSSTSSNVTMNANTLQADKTDTNTALFQQSLNKFTRIADIVLDDLDSKIDYISSSNMPTKLTNITNTKITFLGNIVKTLQSLVDILSKTIDLNPAIISNLNTRIITYNALITTTQNSQIKKEGFQSYTNPYNKPSPNLKQAYEFRLNKSSYSDDVLSGIKSWIL